MDETGTVTAVKHGTAVITVTVDGVSKNCEVTVRSPKITFEQTTITLHPGERARVNATVSSGNQPAYSCSNSNVVSVDANGGYHCSSSSWPCLMSTPVRGWKSELNAHDGVS
ncbi:MAG: hypothetical protein ACLRP8_14560 [Roseburia intestinalis]